MLVLKRRILEIIQIGDARVVILDAARGRVSVGIEAPRDVLIRRGELLERDRRSERGED